MKVATTDQIKHLNQIARERNYNRQIADSLIEILDPLGSHVEVLAITHEHKQMKPCETHIRMIFLAKTLLGVMPARCILDCDVNEYMALEDKGPNVFLDLDPKDLEV